MEKQSPELEHIYGFCPALELRMSTLMAQVVGGDNSAFGELYRQSIRLLYPPVKRICGPHADDALAEAYFQAWKTLHTFDAARCSVVGWLLTIAKSRARDRMRIERTRHGGVDGAVAFNPDSQTHEGIGLDEHADVAKQREQLNTALDSLRGNARWVLGLAYYRDYSHREIASFTGLSLGTVKSHISRSHARLQRLLAKGAALALVPSAQEPLALHSVTHPPRTK